MQHPPDDNDVFDLSQIFIGREQQLDFFQIYLNRWKQLIFNIEPDDTPVTTPPSPYNKLQGLVVLLYGRGGFGKTTLLRRYHNFVLKDNEYPLFSQTMVSKVIDWEFAVEGKRSLFNPPAGQELDTMEFFNALCGQLANALDKDPKQFKEYQAASTAVELASKDAKKVLERLPLERLPNEGQYDWLRGLTVEGIRTLVQTSVPITKVVLDNPIFKKGMDEVAKLTQEQISQVRAKLHDKLGNRLGDYLNPTLRLGLALGRDLAEFAKNFPLLIFFDTYEEIDEGEKLLRIVMSAAGLRVGWVIAGRDNLWAGSEQSKRHLDMEYGYKEIVSPDRGLPIDFNVGGVGAFTTSDIKEFFDRLCKTVYFKPALPRVTEDGAKRILDVTLGIPLAVKIAAGLYIETADLDTVTTEVEGKREIVDKMVQRYLLHTRIDQSERAKLYGLALLRRADRPTGVAAALGLNTEKAKTNYATSLSLLQRRYSFIFTEKDEPSLHQEVRHFLRLWLLEHYQEPDIIAVNEQLKGAHETALQLLEERRQYSSLKERLQDEEWVETYLDLTQQQFWLDPFEGVRYALPIRLAADIFHRETSRDAARIGALFEECMKQPYREWWKWVTQGLISTRSSLAFFSSEDELVGLEKLAVLLRQHRLTFPSPFQDCYTELEATLWWRLGKAYEYEDNNKALEWYEKAIVRLEHEDALKEDVATTCWNIAYKLYEENRWVERIPLLDRAIALKSNYPDAYNSRGSTYDVLKEYELALTDYNRAIELDPMNALVYTNRGNTYYSLKEYELALADHNRAIELDPNYVRAYSNRGITYSHLKEYELALADHNRAIELDPMDTGAYGSRGWTYDDFKEYELALADYNRAIELNPKYAPAYYNRGLVYLELKNIEQAKIDFKHRWELSRTNLSAPWMAEWTGMGKQRPGVEMAKRLEEFAAVAPQHYPAHIGRAVALGLRSQLKQGLAELEQAISLKSEEYDAYFWKGMLSAYYYQDRYQIVIEAINKSLAVNLPPILLTPLYWLEKDRPDFFEKYAKPLLEQYGI